MAWAQAGWAASLRKAAHRSAGQDLQRGQQSQDHRGPLGPGWRGQPVPHPRRSACSCWATFSSSASMADRLSSSWSWGRTPRVMQGLARSQHAGACRQQTGGVASRVALDIWLCLGASEACVYHGDRDATVQGCSEEYCAKKWGRGSLTPFPTNCEAEMSEGPRGACQLPLHRQREPWAAEETGTAPPSLLPAEWLQVGARKTKPPAQIPPSPPPRPRL